MTESQTLTRPLASRVEFLPDTPPSLESLPLPEAVIDAALSALNAGKTHYTDRPGILPLRRWVSEYLEQRFSVLVPPEKVTITCGATEARFVSMKVLAEAGTRVICPGEMSALKGAAHLMDIELVQKLHQPHRVSMAYLTPHDEQPTINALLQLAVANQWWVVWDVSGTVGTSFHPAQVGDLAAQTVTIGSLDEQLPGWRIGWMEGSDMADKLRAYKQSMTICSPSISQWAVTGLVGEPDA